MYLYIHCMLVPFYMMSQSPLNRFSRVLRAAQKAKFY